ncbi:hypothetical protein N431DRAFT_384873 [Stipitochalara longipes BDJ]|nr:hypothetical protein N431DRAFT_384873 [Stipitochalara longipes BDJ]
MASNDGQRLLVLGLTFRQHHTLHMQQVLRAYERLPANPMDRGALYTGLFELAKEINEDETRNLEYWLKNGGEFPAPTPRNPPPTAGADVASFNGDDEEELGEWPAYNPEDFENVPSDGSSNDSDIEEDGLRDDGDGEDESEEERGRQNRDDFADEDDFEEDDEILDAPVRPTRPARTKGKTSGVLIECLICADEYDASEFPPTTQVTSSCHHKNDERVCVYCLQQSIATAVTEGQLHLIICPFCPEKLSHSEVKQFATREIFARYEYLQMMATPDLVMCLGLNCGSGQIHTDPSPMMVCESCSFKTCAVHKLPWHEGQSCEEFDMDDSQIERLEEAEATAKLLAKEHAQVCPNCQNGVSRSEGCDHMTCRCGNEWCYLCGTSYEDIKQRGEEAHAPTCIYHPRRVRVRRDQEQAVQGQLTQLVHGGPVSEALEKARGRRNERVRAELRPLAAQAAERRMREMEKQEKEKKEKGGEAKRPRLNLHAPWEER